MRWSLPLGRFLGIDVFVHATFFLLVAFVGLADWLQHRSFAAVGEGVVALVGIFVCVLLHEYGHALAARRCGIGTRDITLLPIGGVARLDRMPERPRDELGIALAGPAVNVVLAGALAGALLAAGRSPLDALLAGDAGGVLERLFAANVALVVFNLLPAFPMDGGRVLRALLATRLPFARATRIAATTGQAMAVVFGLAGLFFNPLLVLIAVFVWFGAAAEADAAERRDAFAGVPVRAAMVTDFRTVSPYQTVGEGLRLLLAGSQQEFPVVAHGTVVGVLTRERLLESLRAHGEFAPIEAVRDHDFVTLDADGPLDRAVERLAEAPRPGPGLVFADGRLVGLLTAENLGEYCLVRAARATRSAAPRPSSVLSHR